MKDFSHFGIKKRSYPDHNYNAIWNNLKTLRLGSGVAKELPPNHAEFYDVSLGTKCNLECPFCYTDAKKSGRFYENIVEKAKFFFGNMTENQKPFQIAIGSEGEPTIHPEFCDFLETVYNLGIVPNYTTNGIEIAQNSSLSEEILEATNKYVGGVAVSVNEWSSKTSWAWRRTVEKLDKFDNTNINIHYIIKDLDSVKQFISIYDEFKNKVLYFVLLPLMNTGRSTEKSSQEAFDLLLKQDLDFSKIAFGAHFYESLRNQDKIKCWLYPPESLSKNLILDDVIKITPSSFSKEVIWSLPYRDISDFDVSCIQSQKGCNIF